MNQQEPRPPAGADAASRVTPMMEQYVEIRAANPDCLLFYRMGDFYELFFGDAEIASRALGITLTKRGKHLGEEIPMCGVPVHAADDYLQKLIALGFRVAVCEQTEDPAEARRRGGKSVVRRAVTRLITPGTITEERLLEPGRSNYLAAIASAPVSGAGRHALAWLDISTGEFCIATSDTGAIGLLLAGLEPREVLLSDKLAQDAEIRSAIKEIGAALTPLPAAFFDAATAQARLGRACGVATTEAFGDFSRAELAAGAALVAYVEKTQVAARPPIEPPRRVATNDSMRLDGATRANLELFRTSAGSRQGSLLAAVDRTRTAAGARLLAERLGHPLCDPARIAERLDAVQFFVERGELRKAVRAALGSAPDILRALSRLGLERGGPRDLQCIASGVEAAVEIGSRLGASAEEGPALPSGLAISEPPAYLAEALRAALADELPVLKRDGGFVRPGADAALDEARGLRDESRKVVASMQARYAEETGLRGLKIRHNNQLGYFVEVNAAQGPALSADGRFAHRQTMANAMRFTTAELGALDEKIASAAERALGIELEIFDSLAGKIAAADEALRRTARALAEIDVAAALAELAATENYVRPKVDASRAFTIHGGRHPVVEQALKAEGVSFVGNDCDLGPSRPAAPAPQDEGAEANRSLLPSSSGAQSATRGPSALDSWALGSSPSVTRQGEGPNSTTPGTEGADGRGRIWLITGPNMAGKSTFLRQNALIAILAQIGSFVPAARAHVGVIDALFSRVGAADDLARGRSTFMVEMVETAAILNQAGPRALVILDEIGRGTATFDGLSIAWAAIEHLHEQNGCRGLFATHYHELTALSSKLPRLHNATMKVKEWKGDVVFLHEIVPGAADRSYGIQVAKLAGLPPPVIARAKQVLQNLEKTDRSRPKVMINDLPLFSLRPATAAEDAPHPALAALEAINPDELSPKEALERLYELKRLGRESKG